MTEAEVEQKPSYISRVEIEGLWGREGTIDVPFDPAVNIIIGENASGKTTILSLIRCTLQADVFGLMDVPFTQIAIRLASFDNNSVRTIRVVPESRRINYYISGRKFSIPFDAYAIERYGPRVIRQRVLEGKRSVLEELNKLVNIVWLPVARRLPIADEEPDERYASSRGRPIESVDHRLTDLLSELAKFRLGLDNLMAREYKDFERSILTLMLFDKHHDSFVVSKLQKQRLTSDDKAQLIQAFSAADLLSSSTRRKIDEHFNEAEKTVSKLQEKGHSHGFTVREVLMLPLMSRTKSLTELAKNLEVRRNEIFRPIFKFVEVSNSFLKSKKVEVGPSGDLVIRDSIDDRIIHRPSSLSSGEKQIMILLLQALVREAVPSIYMADEPELSLHVTWQEKLIPGLVALGGDMQFIVATHSPDIAGPYPEKIIDIARGADGCTRVSTN